MAEGLTEDDCWRLFQQILDALVHMSGLGIVSPNFTKGSCGLITMQLHRDIKLTNIFIGESYMLSLEAGAMVYVIVLDGKGDCKGKHIVHSNSLKYFLRIVQLGILA